MRLAYPDPNVGTQQAGLPMLVQICRGHPKYHQSLAPLYLSDGVLLKRWRLTQAYPMKRLSNAGTD